VAVIDLDGDRPKRWPQRSMVRLLRPTSGDPRLKAVIDAAPLTSVACRSSTTMPGSARSRACTRATRPNGSGARVTSRGHAGFGQRFRTSWGEVGGQLCRPRRSVAPDPPAGEALCRVQSTVDGPDRVGRTEYARPSGSMPCLRHDPHTMTAPMFNHAAKRTLRARHRRSPSGRARESPTWSCLVLGSGPIRERPEHRVDGGRPSTGRGRRHLSPGLRGERTA